MKPLTLILCLLCMAPATRKGAETLVLLAKKGQRQKALEVQMKVASEIPTNIVLRAIIPPKPVGRTNTVVLPFVYPPGASNYPWWDLEGTTSLTEPVKWIKLAVQLHWPPSTNGDITVHYTPSATNAPVGFFRMVGHKEP